MAAIVVRHPSDKRAERQGSQIPSELRVVVPGETICPVAGFLKGHGTRVEDGNLVATVSGVVERVNKLVCVQPLTARYTGEVGDVLVGRIVEVGHKRWQVDVNSRQHAVLMLSSINLPGGALRRRNVEDELQMRRFFAEGDLISAEVQQFFGEGSISLHTRSLKYGKLQNGQFLIVTASLIKRCKSHFHTLPCGIDLILGNNGYVWIGESTKAAADDDDTMTDGALSGGAVDTAANPFRDISIETREAICRVRNAIVALETLFIAIYLETVWDVYESSLTVEPKAMLDPEVMESITAGAAALQGRGAAHDA